MRAGQGLTLRAMEPEDLAWMYRLENDEELWNLGALNVPVSMHALRQFMANSTSDLYADRQLRLVACLDTDGTVVGCIDLIDYSPRHSRAEVGLVVLPPFRRRGYATQMLECLVRHARQDWFIHRLYAYVAVRNTPAMRLFEKAGFVPEARLTDWLAWGSEAYEDAVMYGKI